MVLAGRAESTDAVHDESQHQVVITKGVGSDANIQGRVEAGREGGEEGVDGWVWGPGGEEDGERGGGGGLGGNEMEF